MPGITGAESLARCIAIDGPTASGKTAVGQALAEALRVGFFDTGLMYRACTLAVMRAGTAIDDERAVTDLICSLPLDMRWPDPTEPHVYLGDEDVTPSSAPRRLKRRSRSSPASRTYARNSCVVSERSPAANPWSWRAATSVHACSRKPGRRSSWTHRALCAPNAARPRNARLVVRPRSTRCWSRRVDVTSWTTPAIGRSTLNSGQTERCS